MRNRKFKIVICSAAIIALLLVIWAAGLTNIFQSKAEAALGQQPSTTQSDTKSASNSSDNSVLNNGTSSTGSTATSESPDSAAIGPAAKADSASSASGDSTAAKNGTSASTGSKQAGASGSSKSGSSTKTGNTQSMSLKEIIKSKGLAASQLQISLFVDKSDKLLTVYNGNTPLKSYHVELGDSGSLDKSISGDHKTPEGIFYITQKLIFSPSDEYLGTRWMRLSYPNIEDAQRGLDSGLINEATYNRIVNAIKNGLTPPQDTALGGGVGIHGGSTAALGTNWTYGCVGLSNRDVEDFYNYVKVGTKVTIRQ